MQLVYSTALADRARTWIEQEKAMQHSFLVFHKYSKIT